MTRTILPVLLLLASLSCFSQTANRFDVIITEIMADPSPFVGLPNAEFIELKNVSALPFNLNGWRLSDVTSTSTISSSFILQPDSIVVLCANSNLAAFSVFGRTIGVSSFPSLDNDGDVLTLRSPQNRIIHSVGYTTDWYANEAKKEGGWSLEMIDTKNPCTGKSNWKASTNNLGGTPGKQNAVNGINVDDVPPQLKRAYAADNVTIVLVFDESLDSTTAAMAGNFVLPGFGIVSSTPVAPLFQSVQLKLSSPLQTSLVYTISVNAITDCKGNAIGAYNKTKIGLPQDAQTNDVAINEILFNPKTGGFDYVEFYNTSNKVFDASKLYIANRGTNGNIGSLKKLSE
ncbi:MAG TPA: lamin tail domain-containing protein, partial [Flavisolibacter sp.]